MLGCQTPLAWLPSWLLMWQHLVGSCLHNPRQTWSLYDHLETV